MTQPDIWARLAEPFPPDVVRERPGPGNRVLHYVDARIVAQRLDDVLTPAGWNFTCSVIPGSDIVKGRLEVFDLIQSTVTVREDHGYPNSERDEEPIKAATSDALKRCAVLFGIGRHLYDDNSQRRISSPARPSPSATGSPPPPVAGGAAGRPPRPVASTVPPEPEDIAEVFGKDAHPLRFGEFRNEIEAVGKTLQEAGAVAKRMYGHSMVKDLTDAQRGDLLAELLA